MYAGICFMCDSGDCNNLGSWWSKWVNWDLSCGQWGRMIVSTLCIVNIQRSSEICTCCLYVWHIIYMYDDAQSRSAYLAAFYKWLSSRLGVYISLKRQCSSLYIIYILVNNFPIYTFHWVNNFPIYVYHYILVPYCTWTIHVSLSVLLHWNSDLVHTSPVAYFTRTNSHLCILLVNKIPFRHCKNRKQLS